jgi:hypothetical protein
VDIQPCYDVSVRDDGYEPFEQVSDLTHDRQVSFPCEAEGGRDGEVVGE